KALLVVLDRPLLLFLLLRPRLLLGVLVVVRPTSLRLSGRGGLVLLGHVVVRRPAALGPFSRGRLVFDVEVVDHLGLVGGLDGELLLALRTGNGLPGWDAGLRLEPGPAVGAGDLVDAHRRPRNGVAPILRAGRGLSKGKRRGR